MVKFLKYLFVFVVGVSAGTEFWVYSTSILIKNGRMQEIIDQYKERIA